MKNSKVRNLIIVATFAFIAGALTLYGDIDLYGRITLQRVIIVIPVFVIGIFTLVSAVVIHKKNVSSSTTQSDQSQEEPAE